MSRQFSGCGLFKTPAARASRRNTCWMAASSLFLLSGLVAGSSAQTTSLLFQEQYRSAFLATTESISHQIPIVGDQVVDAQAEPKPASKPQDPKPGQATKEAGKEAVAPDIQVDALWDGRNIAPFHALDNPKMVPASEADFLDDKEYVLALTINGQSRAYPTRFVWYHHFINDKTDKAGPDYPAFVLTYCSVCNAGIRFDARVDGKPLLFDFYGLYNGVAIMCDRDTQSVWLPVEGRAVTGPMLGKKLITAPVLDTTWGHWKKLHPDTLVMSPDEKYKRIYGDKDRVEARGYDHFPAPFFAQSLTRRDKRLPAFEKVLAVRLSIAGKDAKAPETFLCRAYPIAALKQAQGVVNDTLGTLPVAVFLEPETVTAVAVSRVLDGRTLTFESRKESNQKEGGKKEGDTKGPDVKAEGAKTTGAKAEGEQKEGGSAAIYDKETGTRWSIEGVGEAGPLAGKTPTRLDNHLSQWYGWVAYYPETSIYGRADAPQTENIDVKALRGKKPSAPMPAKPSDAKPSAAPNTDSPTKPAHAP